MLRLTIDFMQTLFPRNFCSLIRRVGVFGLTLGLVLSSFPLNMQSVEAVGGEPEITWAKANVSPGEYRSSYGAAAVSSDGQVIALEVAGRITISTDGGNVWRQPSIGDGGTNNWAALSMSQSGQIMLAGVDNACCVGRVYRSVDYGSTWAEVRPAGDVTRAWRFTAMSGDGQVMLAGYNSGRLYRSLDSGVTWSEIQPAGNVNRNWVSGGMSSDGQVMLAAARGGRLYRSLDGGGTWGEVRPGGENVNKNWMTASMSANGMVMLAGVEGGRLYRSLDGGSTWAETRPKGDIDAAWVSSSVSSDGLTVLLPLGPFRSTDGGETWVQLQPDLNRSDMDSFEFVAMSGDGQAMLLIPKVQTLRNDFLYRSSDGGNSWMADMTVNSHNWEATRISDDGQIMLATESSQIHRSVDGGVAWTTITPAGSDGVVGWAALAMSPNGQVLLATQYFGRLWRSVNGGDTWTEARPAGDIGLNWRTVAVSADGQTMMASDQWPGYLFYSHDGGDTWTEAKPAGDVVGLYWGTTAMSADGRVMIAGVLNGRLYRSIDSGVTWSEIRPAGDVNTGWWSTAFVSPDGQTMIVGNRYVVGGPYKSIDGGETWTLLEPTGYPAMAPMSHVAASLDGQSLLVAGWNNSGGIYYSPDGGVNWNKLEMTGRGRSNWGGVALRADGKVLMAAEYGGSLYIGKIFPKAPALTLPADTKVAKAAVETLALTGTAPAGMTVEVEVHSTPQSGTVVVNSSGVWSWTPPIALEPGEHQYRARVVDNGLEGEWSDWVSFQVLGASTHPGLEIPNTGGDGLVLRLLGLELMALALVVRLGKRWVG